MMSECHRSRESEAEGVVGDARCQWEASIQADIHADGEPDIPLAPCWRARGTEGLPAAGWHYQVCHQNTAPSQKA